MMAAAIRAYVHRPQHTTQTGCWPTQPHLGCTGPTGHCSSLGGEGARERSGEDTRWEGLLVLPDLLHWLPGPDHVHFPVHHHHLGGFGEGVVVLRRHARAVRPRALNDDDVTGLGSTQLSLRQRLRVAWGRAHEVATLAAVAAHHILGALILARRLARHHHDRMLCSIQAGAQHVSHASVELDESVPLVCPCLHNIVHRRNERASVRDEERSRLDLHVELAFKLGGKLLEDVLDDCAVRLEVGALLVLHAPHLVSSAEVERCDIGELLAQPNRQPGALAPHSRV
mmetsp:Transcript_9250/g.18470  ORF Transcript_9250/g.18470 Transcript_9250/m.18470 type:complete len:284 (+) Transcript_9250:152-1003(+)